MNETLKKCLITIGMIMILIIGIGSLVILCEHMRISGELCQTKCEELNLSVERVHYEYEPWWQGAVKACDCKLPDYVRIKVKT